VFVCWGGGETGLAAVRREVTGFEVKELEEEEFDEFDYAHADKFYIDRSGLGLRSGLRSGVG